MNLLSVLQQLHLELPRMHHCSTLAQHKMCSFRSHLHTSTATTGRKGIFFFTESLYTLMHIEKNVQETYVEIYK